MSFKHGYSPSIKVHPPRGDVSLTKQSFKKECDINNILKRYMKTGLIDHINKHQGVYTDLSTSTEYHEAMNIIMEANDSFSLLPSEIRNKFNNDPAQFLDFVSNPDNRQEMAELGLLNPPEIPQGFSISPRSEASTLVEGSEGGKATTAGEG